MKLGKDDKSRRDIARSIGQQYSSIQHAIYNFKYRRVYSSKPHLSRPSKLTIKEKRRTNTMSHRSHLTDSEAWRVIGRLDGGQTQAEVAQANVVSQSVISRIWNRFLETGSAGRRPGQGRRWATKPNEDRYLVLTAPRHRNMHATLLQQHLRLAAGTTVSTQSVRNRLHGVGLYLRQPIVCVRLTSRHRRDHREWATEHANWRINEWSNVLFSDESRFFVHPDNRRVFIWRDRGIRNNPPTFVHEIVRFCGGEVLVYGGISIDGRTYLYIIRDGPLSAR
ncbi:transposable element Tcb2 transposase [Trichonephila clavipes]|nr:transposable element Tcb2 transposase [Trichonephila clavipes]